MSERDFNPSYIGRRPDIERLVPPDARAVLDVGCSTGTLGAAVKARTGALVVGIELSREMAQVASERIDEVLVGDAAELIILGGLENRRFDTIIFADVLEHMVDPWAVLRAAVGHLEPGGAVIASIPNVGHMDTISNLVFKERWPYRERGIHDRTHLRFFARKNVVELFKSAGLSIERMQTNYRFIEKPLRINRLARVLAVPGLRGLLAFQYLVRGRLAGPSTAGRNDE
jgi:2-polyprenyl-3-methyl-5-hydroxy-6-metoxy-1,4-benzoquinol methylase